MVRLAEIGAEVGHRITDLLVVREKSGKREIKILSILLFIKGTVWKSLFGREADKLEHANDDDRTYYIIEKEALVNKFISVPKDKGSLNCASFIAGIVEAILCDCGFVSTNSCRYLPRSCDVESELTNSFAFLAGEGDGPLAQRDDVHG